MAIRVLFIALLLFLSACNSSDDSPNGATEASTWVPAFTSEWAIASPEAAGFDRAAFESAYQQAGRTFGLTSMCVIRNNALIGESYYSDNERASLHHVRSVTKTVMAILIGIAIDRGILDDVDQPIGPFFAATVPDLAPEKAAITIRHLLTMTSGFSWDESSASGYNNWANSSNPIRYVLDRPLSHEPGSTFNYNSGAVHLLSVILTEATGQSTRSFAESNLFEPLGFRPVRWETLADGHHNGGAGLELRTLDMAKIGRLLMQSGTWGEIEIVPESWVRQMKTKTRDSHGSYGAFKDIDYGFLWWLGTGSGDDLQLAWGWGGQFIATFPDQDLIVVTTAKWNVGGDTAGSQEQANINLIIDYVRQALH